MNPSADLPDPLFKGLTEEAGALPGIAALEARRTHARRVRRRRHSAVALAATVSAVCAWQALAPHRTPRNESLPVSIAQMPPPPPAPMESPTSIKVQTVRQAMAEPLPLPSGLSAEQRDVLESARGLPLLLVKDSSGKVTRIHVIER